MRADYDMMHFLVVESAVQLVLIETINVASDEIVVHLDVYTSN